MIDAAHEEYAIGDGGRCHDNFADGIDGQEFMLWASLDDEDFAVFAAQINLAVRSDG